MLDQLERLQRAVQHPAIKLQVIGFDYGIHPGTEANFILLELGDMLTLSTARVCLNPVTQSSQRLTQVPAYLGCSKATSPSRHETPRKRIQHYIDQLSS